MEGRCYWFGFSALQNLEKERFFWKDFQGPLHLYTKEVLCQALELVNPQCLDWLAPSLPEREGGEEDQSTLGHLPILLS